MAGAAAETREGEAEGGLIERDNAAEHSYFIDQPSGSLYMIEADLGQHLEEILDDLIASGRYRSKDDVLREGVRLVQEREARLSAVDEAVRRGLADVEAGRTRLAADVFDQLAARYEKLKARGH